MSLFYYTLLFIVALAILNIVNSEGFVLKIQIILGSVRENRVGERVAGWVQTQARLLPGFDVELVDLANFDLPHFAEPVSPRYNQHRQPHSEARRWLDVIARADGYIFITPEYNHSIPGPLKNAIDYTDFQLAKKPVAIVSYGTVGGARAAEQLKLVLVEAKAAVVPEAVAILKPGGELSDNNPSLDRTLTELAWWTRTLKAGREQLEAVTI
jgi:NAD(P)H-dependent FMN reductase